MLLAVGSIALALLLLALLAQDTWLARRLPIIEQKGAQPEGPLVSIIIPARNEERVIERCVRGALAQSYPSYEVLTVDDGSTDATGSILERLRQEHPQLSIVAGTSLPPGWKGKQHAICTGYAVARGEWLLFLDADTAPEPELVAALVDFARRNNADMLTLLPLLELGSFWERAILPAFSSLIAAVFPLASINDPGSDIALANGQCIFIRRSVYEAVGTHAAVRSEIAEDLALARRVKAAGWRLMMADGRHLLRVRMYHSGAEVVEGLAKNAMAGVEVGGRRAVLGVARQSLIALGPFLLLAAAVWTRLRCWPLRWRRVTGATAATVVPLSVWGWGRMYRLIFAQPARYGLLYPLGIAAYGLIGLYAALRLRFGRGVIWKGRRYNDIR